MPTPRSAIAIIARPASALTRTAISLPAGEYFKALVTRLFTICSMRTGSPSIQTGATRTTKR